MVYEYSSQRHENKPTTSNDGKNVDCDPFDGIMYSFFGASSYNPELSWDELGMVSMISIEVRDAISDSFQVILEPDCFEVYTTPAALKDFVVNSDGGGVPLQINLSPLLRIESRTLPWCLFGCIQALYSAFLVFIFAFSIVPAWFVGKFVANQDAISTTPALGGGGVRCLDMVPHCRPSVDVIIVLQCDSLEMDNDLEVPGGDRHHSEHSIPTMVGS